MSNKSVEKFLFFPSGAFYLGILGVLLGAGLFSSGLVTWIAANWDGFSHFTKLYGIQFIFVFCVLAGLFSFARRRQEQALHLGSRLWFFLAAVGIGGLFALIGQTYQTGADVWQLFAVWTFFQLFLLIALPHIASALLFFSTLVLSLVLWLETLGLDLVLISWMALGISLVLLIATEWFKDFFHDRQWRVLIRLSALAVAYSLVYLQIAQFNTGRISEAIWYSKGLITVFGLALSTVGVWFYSKIIRDVVIVVLAVLSFIYSVFMLLGEDFLELLFDLGGLVFLGFWLFAIGIGGTLFIRRLFMSKRSSLTHSSIQQDDGVLVQNKTLDVSKKPLHWALQLFLLLMTTQATAIVVAGIVLLSGSEDSVFPMGLLLSGVAWGLYRESIRQGNNETQEIIAQALMLSGLGCMLLDVFVLNSYGEGLWVKKLSLLLLLGFVFWQIKTFLMRMLSFAAFWFLLMVIIFDVFFDQEDIAEHSVLVINSVLFFLVALMSLWSGYRLTQTPRAVPSMQAHSLRDLLSPMMWGGFIYLFGSGILFSSMMGMVSPDTVATNEAHFFSHEASMWVQMTGGLYQQFIWQKFSAYLFALSPALLAYGLRSEFPARLRWISVLVLLGLGGLWIDHPQIILCLDMLLLAYFLCQQGLFWVGIVGILVSLSMLYYSLESSLLNKSYFLLGIGTVLLVIVAMIFALTKPRTALESSRLGLWQGAGKRVLIATVITLVGVLGLANYSIDNNERILREGQPIILALAPLDPRSIMQGDYMELNFALLNDVDVDINESRYAYLYLKEDAQGVMQMCHSSAIQEASVDCPNAIWIKAKRGKWQWRLSTHQYFFPEGLASYFEQARYGEFRRAEDGTILLKQLLDEKLQPLTRP